jgi:LysM repeat protein
MSCQYQPGTFAYIARPGDSFNTIANHFGIPVQVIFDVNRRLNPVYLHAGQVVCIPQSISTRYQEELDYPEAQNVYYSQEPGDPPLGPPSAPPPNFIPSEPGLYAIDPGAIAGCLFHFTYLWLSNGQSFWAFPVYVGRTSVSGWRYQRDRWVYFGIDVNEIRSFTCAPYPFPEFIR